ncbi:hypothetical protein RHGRI_027865 [Rhododendron griersonianum]|uniref:Uncharacterized protein n=1 Tax=Rhododendron griersonianum TaxID=479676 RepID=A0AAV6J035_9ERIC|nr:hypothetical protein RHGRI_027865 [Rhododendron griersonianum]
MLVAFTISSNMFFVPLPKLFSSLFDFLITSIFTHGLGAVIGISVRDELWVARDILDITGIAVVSLNPKPIEGNWCCNWYDN